MAEAAPPGSPDAIRRFLPLATVALGFLAFLVFWHGVDWWHLAIGSGLIVLAGAGLVARIAAPSTAPSEPEPRVLLTDLSTEALVAALPMPAILVDQRLVVRSHNTRVTEIVPGLRRGEPLLLSLRVPEVLEAVRRAASTNQAQAIDYAERVPVQRWYGVEAAPVAVTTASRESGSPDFVLITLKDRTEERRLERLRADFVANASHELRTPLASIVGFIETIQGPARNDPSARERFLGIMLAQAQRMARLIDDLMSLSRVELNEHVRPVAPVNIVMLVDQVRETLAPFARNLGVVVQLEASEPRLNVAGDRDELFRLFENLLQNAIKYGAEGRKVEITVAREARARRRDDAVVAVRDFGPGIPAEHLPRLTERFYRVDVTSSREKGGTGLGLALVKHIINRHRGRLSIDSEPGKGATFTIRLETVEDKPSVPALARGPAQPAPGPGGRGADQGA